MMRLAVAILSKDDPAAGSGRRYNFCLPAVDLRQHGFHFRIAEFVFRIPPVKNAERFVHRVARCFHLCDQTQRELMNEPRVGATIPGRINGFLAPLQKSLRVGECTFLFGVTGGREKENFCLDVLGLQLAALNLGRFTPEICRFDFDHVAHD